MKRKKQPCRDALAQEIFLKKLPPIPLTEAHRKYYEGAVDSAYETADLFLRRRDELLAEEKISLALEVPEDEL
jgi:hypothetical protein